VEMKEVIFNRIRLIIATAVLVLFTIGAFCQTIDSLVVVPEYPTTSDEVSVHIYGWLWSSDVFIADINVFQGSYSFSVDIDFAAGGIGLPVLLPFDTIVNFGMLSAYSDWNITVNTIFSGTQQETHSTQFAGTDPTGVEPVARFDKAGNYPNPFIEKINFKFSLNKTERVNLIVYDILGKEQAIVISSHLPPGEYDIPFDARKLTPGKYFYQLKIGGKITKQIYRSAG
jgi:hypothetical protein